MKTSVDDMTTVNKEILLGFWKIHILHHAAEEPAVGQWMLRELQRHGYEVSPGTLYPMRKRMEGHGWLRSEVELERGPKAPRRYYLTDKGRAVLAVVESQLAELLGELRTTPER